MAKKDTVKVSRIEIDLGDRKISLTLKQAEALFGQLEDLFGKKVEIVERHHWDYWRVRPWWGSLQVDCTAKLAGSYGVETDSHTITYNSENEAICFAAG